MTTGIYVSLDQIFITDFEHNRVLIFDLNGKFEQVISEELAKPTDIFNKRRFLINCQL